MMSWSIRRKPGGPLVGSTASAEGMGTYGRLLPTGRPEAFSDGVFAIAITLLVLELHVPTGQEALLRGLEHEWPRYLPSGIRGRDARLRAPAEYSPGR
jgi:hypothetical protein